MRDGTIEDGDVDPSARNYHLYVQWLMHEQMRALAEKAKETGVGLYLDLPLGVVDSWAELGLPGYSPRALARARAPVSRPLCPPPHERSLGPSNRPRDGAAPAVPGA